MMISRSKHRSTVEVCADCGASDPSWASINRGLLLCAECCSVHRSMGRHISHVKSLRQGSWPPSLLAMVQALTAQNVNSIWEHSLLDTSAPKHLRKKPQPKDPLHPTKSEFIHAKHLRLAYVLRARRDEPPSELGRQLHSAVRSASLDTAMRLLAQGADPNYYNQEKGTRCLHVACRAGQPLQAELLVAWGADPAARDADGHSPEECARLGGHTELADRLVELVFEAPDRLVFHLSGTRPSRSAGAHYSPAPCRAIDMTDGAKAARGKLQLLPNHLFEELVMDIYDEIDRRETEAIWQTSASGLERSGVAFLPVNPALSAPRNQGRQKLARLSSAEVNTLLRDVLMDANRRQHIATLQPRGISYGRAGILSQASDEEPLYDSVASDDDYAALAPVDVDMTNILPRQGETVASSYNASLPLERPSTESRRTQSPSQFTVKPPEQKVEIECLKKELDSRDSTITELKSQLKSLQTIVEQLTKENSVLKTNSFDDSTSVASQSSCVFDSASNVDVKERGKSLDSNGLGEDALAPVRGQRPVSMYETREGPKNNWQVTKHQLTTLSGLERSLADVLERPPPTATAAAPSGPLVHSRAEEVTRAIQQLWADARHHQPSLSARPDDIQRAVSALLALFPPTCPDRELNLVLCELRAACERVSAACSASSPLNEVRAAAYDLAKATKLLVTHYNDEQS